MTQTIPAKRFDKMPQYQFAVFSVRKGSDTAELESSFVSQSYAGMLFDRQYSKWGFQDTNFYLVDWESKNILRSHEVWTTITAIYRIPITDTRQGETV